jgi:hypothetical protein
MSFFILNRKNRALHEKSAGLAKINAQIPVLRKSRKLIYF